MAAGEVKVVNEPSRFQMLIIIFPKQGKCHDCSDLQGQLPRECVVSQWAMNVFETISGTTLVESQTGFEDTLLSKKEF